jgi:hypothetical protein
MEETIESITKEIKDYIQEKGNISKNWKVCLTNMPRKAFKECNVDRKNGFWIYITAKDKVMAESVVKSLVENGLTEVENERFNDFKIIFVYDPTR